MRNPVPKPGIYYLLTKYDPLKRERVINWHAVILYLFVLLIIFNLV
jgi:hypothetical protein